MSALFETFNTAVKSTVDPFGKCRFGRTRLTYIKYLKLTVGKAYTVVFYNSQGTVIAHGTVVISDSSDYWI